MAEMMYLFRRAWENSKRLFAIVALKGAFCAFVPLLDIAGLALVVNALVAGQPLGEIMWLTAAFIGAQLLLRLLEAFLNWRHDVEARKVSDGIAFGYAKDNLRVDYHYVQDRSIETLRQRLMRLDPGSFLGLWGNFLKYLVQFSGLMVVFTALSPPFIAVQILFTAALICITFATRKNEFKLGQAKVDDGRRLEYLYEVMSGSAFAKEVRLSAAGEYVTAKYEVVQKRMLAGIRGFYRKALALGAAGAALITAQAAAMYAYFSYQAFSRNVSVAQYTALMGAATMFTTLMLDFFDNLTQIRQRCEYVAFHRQYTEMVKEKSSIADSDMLTEAKIDFPNADFRLNNVTFTYPGAEKPTLRGVSLTIPAGKRVGIVGLNGAGKTTLVKLLTRLYDPTEGSVTAAGVNLRSLPQHQLCRHVAVVLQDYLLLAYSVRENVTFGADCDEARLMEILDKSGLASRVAKLPKGVETSVYRTLDDSGVELSGGEGQKLALARALYKNADLLILDEPSSALDPLAEYELFSRLDELAHGKTSVFISHRLSSTRFCDNIYLIDDGRVAEAGTHDELLHKGGLYAGLYESQARYYREAEVTT